MAQTNSTTAAGGGEPGHELDAPPWLRVESTLMATANAIRDAYDCRLAPLGLNLSTASLLAYVADFGPVNQTRVAEHLGQGRAVTGTQIDKLESRGVVERRPDPSDRRVWLVAITASGTELAASIADVDRIFRAELREGISRADRQTLAGLLVRLHDNIHRSSGRDAAPDRTAAAAMPSTNPSTNPSTPTDLDLSQSTQPDPTDPEEASS
jgi:MarR family transcriptional regulator for hemolysin